MKIYSIASEVDPFAKTGGLADVDAALPKSLAALGHEVRLVLPLYRQVDRQRFGLRPTAASVSAAAGPQARTLRVWEGVLPNSRVPVFFPDHAPLFQRGGLYQEEGRDYPDNLERFSVFCQGALRLLQTLEWTPDVIHAHDWQAGLALAHLAAGPLGREPLFHGTGRVFTVHNLAYQGLFPRDAWRLTGLPDTAFSTDGLEYYGQISCLKAGLLFAHALTTVSPTYAQEIQTAEFGCGLDGLLRARREDLTGILNGIDPDEWNPAADRHLAAAYSANDLAGKALCRQALRQSRRLPEAPGLLVGMIQRLVDQKGVDLFLAALDSLMALPVQCVLLGTGDARYHEQLAEASARFPDRLSVALTFDAPLAHQIEAGADAFLMPSRFEPCGLNQMYSMRYGTVPIVRRVGGLADTVVDAGPASAPMPSATGFAFEEASPRALAEAVRRAAAAFGQPARWTALMKAGMRQDFSWARSAQAYVQVYQRAISAARGSGFGVLGKAAG